MRLLAELCDAMSGDVIGLLAGGPGRTTRVTVTRPDG